MKSIPTLGQGEIVRGENGQLRDNLSRLWCACGQPAVLYREKNVQPYRFLCLECMKEE